MSFSNIEKAQHTIYLLVNWLRRVYSRIATLFNGQAMKDGKTMKELLLKAEKVLSEEGSWTQGAWGHDENGDSCAPAGKLAVRWSTEGAIYKAGVEVDALASTVLATLRLLQDCLNGLSVVAWNDADVRTRSDVIDLFRRAQDAA